MQHRRPTVKEAKDLLLELANRMERTAKNLELAATVDVHRKNGLTAYLQTEAGNIRSFVRRESRLLEEKT